MNLDEYQRRALRTAGTFDSDEHKLVCSALGAAGEAGEFANVVKKFAYHGHSHDGVWPKAVEELGDVLWYLALAADALEISLEAVAERNLAKLERRYPSGFDPERSRRRLDGDA